MIERNDAFAILAEAITDEIVVTGVGSQTASWLSARPRIGDLPPAHLGYPAAAAAVSSGVLGLTDGLFRPTRPVSGAEAIEAVERLEGLAR